MSLVASATNVPGTLRQELLVAGRHRLVTDQPESLGGGDAGPSPHELFAGALAGCVAVTLARYARTKEWDLGEIRVDVDYDHKAVPRRVRVDVAVDADLSEEQRARLERVAAACPLRRSLAVGYEFEERLVGAATASARP